MQEALDNHYGTFEEKRFTAKDALALSEEYRTQRLIDLQLKEDKDREAITKWVNDSLECIKEKAITTGEKRIILTDFAKTTTLSFKDEASEALEALGFKVEFKSHRDSEMFVDWR